MSNMFSLFVVLVEKHVDILSGWWSFSREKTFAQVLKEKYLINYTCIDRKEGIVNLKYNWVLILWLVVDLAPVWLKFQSSMGMIEFGENR